jgi:hypothetical protein
MKHVHRWLLNTLAAISLLLAAATAIVWTRSYWIQDSLLWTDDSMQPCIHTESRKVMCAHGGMQLWHEYWEWHGGLDGFIPWGHHFEHTSSQSPVYPYFVNQRGQTPPPADIRFKGFEFVYLNYRDPFMMGKYPMETVRQQSVTFPLAAIFFPAIILSVLAKRWEMKLRGRLMKGLCPTCGYDLRATPDRCPECGTIPAKTIHSV